VIFFTSVPKNIAFFGLNLHFAKKLPPKIIGFAGMNHAKYKIWQRVGVHRQEHKLELKRSGAPHGIIGPAPFD
jgi:hypothetical protein